MFVEPRMPRPAFFFRPRPRPPLWLMGEGLGVVSKSVNVRLGEDFEVDLDEDSC